MRDVIDLNRPLMRIKDLQTMDFMIWFETYAGHDNWELRWQGFFKIFEEWKQRRIGNDG